MLQSFVIQDGIKMHKEKNQAANMGPKWTVEEDEVLCENYDTFKDLPDFCTHLATLISSKTAKDIQERITLLKLHKGKAKAKARIEKLHKNSTISSTRLLPLI
jgi:hypothetical protein